MISIFIRLISWPALLILRPKMDKMRSEFANACLRTMTHRPFEIKPNELLISKRWIYNKIIHKIVQFCHIEPSINAANKWQREFRKHYKLFSYCTNFHDQFWIILKIDDRDFIFWCQQNTKKCEREKADTNRPDQLLKIYYLWTHWCNKFIA